MLWLFFFGLTTENNFFFHSRLLFSFYCFFFIHWQQTNLIESFHSIVFYFIDLSILLTIRLISFGFFSFIISYNVCGWWYSFIHSWLIRFWNCHICVKAKAELLFFVVVVVISLVRWYMRKKNLPQAIVVNIKIEGKKICEIHTDLDICVCVFVCVTLFILVVSWSYAMIMMRNS